MPARPRKPVTTSATREPRVAVKDPFRVAVRLAGSEETVCGWVKNLSLGGMYVANKARFPEETPVTLESLYWEGETAHHLCVAGWVARTDTDGMGIQFDSASADRRLIRHLIDRLAAGTS